MLLPQLLIFVEENENKHSLGDQRPENITDSMESQVNTLAGRVTSSFTPNLQSQAGVGGLLT